MYAYSRRAAARRFVYYSVVDQFGTASNYINGNNAIMSVLIRNYLKTRNNDKNTLLYTCCFQTHCCRSAQHSIRLKGNSSPAAVLS